MYNDQKQVNMYNANLLEVLLTDGTKAYFEAQEHCDLFSLDGFDGLVCGYYKFDSTESNHVTFYFNDSQFIKAYKLKEVDGNVLRYSHDYGKSWNING